MSYEACTVQRKCSSEGKACTVEDRECQNAAISRGLEITCESVEPRGWVYCPPGGQQRDSSIVWILLCVAFAVVIVGAIFSYKVFLKRLR